MRLSAELIGSAEQRTNPLDEREIILRGLAIPAIEHLAVTRDAFDTIDLTDNRLSRVDNIPRLNRLSNLLLAGNLIETIDTANMARNVPNVRYIDLSYNRVSSLYEVSNLGKSCPNLEILSLHGNAVQRKCISVVLLLLVLMSMCVVFINNHLHRQITVCQSMNLPARQIYFQRTLIISLYCF